MATYCVTFRIADKTIGGKTYNDRREALINNVYEQGNGYWEETTSFFLMSSNLQTPAFLKKATQGLSQADDLVIAFDPEDMSAAYFGPLKDRPVLASFFASLQKVP
jgi:hypothetical protein